MRLKCGWIFSFDFTANLPLSVNIKSVNISQMYHHEFVVSRFLKHDVSYVT